MLDEKDMKILKELKKNSRLSVQKIANNTGIPSTTVFNRIKQLEKSNVIKGYTVVLDEGKMGKNMAAYILITVDYNLLKKRGTSQHELAAKLKHHELVDDISIVTGIGDIIVKIRTQDITQLNEFVTKYIRNIEGVENTQTSIVLESF